MMVGTVPILIVVDIDFYYYSVVQLQVFHRAALPDVRKCRDNEPFLNSIRVFVYYGNNTGKNPEWN